MKIHRPIKYSTLLPLKAVQRHSYEIIDQGQVDNEQWYVVQAEPKVARWMRTQNKDLWYDYKVGSNLFHSSAPTQLNRFELGMSIKVKDLF